MQGIEHADKERYEKAEKFFRRALEENPSDLAAVNNLALAVAKIGDIKEAERIIRKAMKSCEHEEGYYHIMKKNLETIRAMESRIRKSKKSV